MQGSAGFSLIETLAALAIASAIMLSSSTLMYQVVYFFDAGTARIDQSEQLALAIDSLVHDFAATRFVVEETAGEADNTSKTIAAAFIASPETKERPASVKFITSGSHGAEARGEEVVKLTIEHDDEFTKLVRRRSTWIGPMMVLRDAHVDDPVVLLKGRFSLVLHYSEIDEGGTIIWHDHWTGKRGLPHSVRLDLQDLTTGKDLLSGLEFRIASNGSPACATGDQKCLTLNPEPKSAKISE